MARTLFFRIVLSKLSEINSNKTIFSQCNIFYNYEYFFFQCAFLSLFNHRQKIQSDQEQYSLCCNLPCFRVLLCTHYGPLRCFSRYFRKLKEIGVYGPYFQTMLFLVTMFWVIPIILIPCIWISHFCLFINLSVMQFISNMFIFLLWEETQHVHFPALE